MSAPNIKPTYRAMPLVQVGPISQGAGSVSTGWVDAGVYDTLHAVVAAGVLGTAATLDAKLEQATTAGGAGVKDVTGKTVTQLVKATDDNKVATINVRSEELDVNGGYRFVRLTLTVGAAASLVYGALFGHDARYQPPAAPAFVKSVT